MDDQKSLKFVFDNLFQFTCTPNGYGPAMRMFTTKSEVPFSHLRSLSHNYVVCVDDSYLQGDTYESCLYNVLDTLNLLRVLGFAINPEKPILTPSQEIVFLRFVTSSKKMTLTLTNENKIKITALMTHCLNNIIIPLIELAKIIGNIVTSFPAVTYGPLHYRHLERYKILGLKVTCTTKQ